jgi:hypothetical protein
MKRTQKLWFAVGILCLSTMFAASTTFARYRHYYRHHVPPPAVQPAPVPPPHAWQVPPPGPSPWCQRHPSRCHAHGADDAKVNNQREHCMDAKGNGDGFISPWEHQQFAKVCR